MDANRKERHSASSVRRKLINENQIPLFKVLMAEEFGGPAPELESIPDTERVQRFQEWLDAGESGLNSRLEELGLPRDADKNDDRPKDIKWGLPF